MPLIIGSLISVISSLFVAVFTYIAQTFTKRLIIFSAVMAALAISLNVFINLATDYIVSLTSDIAIVPFVAYFLPSNLDECITIVLAIKFSGTLFNVTRNFLENKLTVS